jgi:hypothetical protein
MPYYKYVFKPNKLNDLEILEPLGSCLPQVIETDDGVKSRTKKSHSFWQVISVDYYWYIFEFHILTYVVKVTCSQLSVTNFTYIENITPKHYTRYICSTQLECLSPFHSTGL